MLPYAIGVEGPPVPQTYALPSNPPVYRSILVPRAATSLPTAARSLPPSAATIHGLFENAPRTSRCLGRRARSSPSSSSSSSSSFAPAFEWISTAHAASLRNEIGAGISHLLRPLFPDLLPIKKSVPLKTNALNIGIYTINRPDWVLVDLACASYGFASVALYDTLGPDTSTYIINDAELSIVFASLDKIPNLIEIAPNCPSLKFIVCIDPLVPSRPGIANFTSADISLDSTRDPCGFPTPPLAELVSSHASLLLADSLFSWAESRGVRLVTLAQLRRFGAAHPRPHRVPAPADIATVCYTSGTTGNPKGALLTHGNFASVSVLADLIKDGFTTNDVYLSYLPLAHIFERAALLQCLHGGVQIAFSCGVVERIVEDLQLLRPTIFISVPRLLNRIYARVRAATLDAPGLRGAVFRRAYAGRVAAIKRGRVYDETFLQARLFARVAALLGGRVRIIISGSAPLSGTVLTFLRAVFRCEVVEGYGLTETTAPVTVQMPGEHGTKHVGPPLPHCEIMLVPADDLGYLPTDRPRPRGEVAVRGANVFAGYLGLRDATDAALTRDGWFLTGDIGAINENGTLSIIDRKKNIFKLAQGEYCAPEKLENAYSTNPLVAQIFVHGDPLQSALVAVVVPNPETYEPWLQRVNGGGSSPLPVLLPVLLLRELDKTAHQKKLRGFEFVKAIHIETGAPFSVENGLLTPSFKLRRAQAAERYRDVLQRLYAELAAAGAGANSARPKL